MHSEVTCASNSLLSVIQVPTLLSFFHETAFTGLVSLFREQLRFDICSYLEALTFPGGASLHQFSLEPSAGCCGSSWGPSSLWLQALRPCSASLTSAAAAGWPRQEQGREGALCGAHWVWACLFDWTGYDKGIEEAKQRDYKLTGFDRIKVTRTVSFSFYEGHFKSASQVD